MSSAARLVARKLAPLLRAHTGPFSVMASAISSTAPPDSLPRWYQTTSSEVATRMDIIPDPPAHIGRVPTDGGHLFSTPA